MAAGSLTATFQPSSICVKQFNRIEVILNAFVHLFFCRTVRQVNTGLSADIKTSAA